MRVYGVDFTSRPRRSKPIHVAVCDLEGDVLRFLRLEQVRSFAAFEASLMAPGPWIAGFDFPFTQPRRFLTGIGWPTAWPAFAAHLGAMDREAYRAALEGYKRDRPMGDREHPRGFEAGTGAASPQKLHGVPVALMLFEGVPRLHRAGVQIPGLCEGDPARVAFEAYPGVAARTLIGRASYKTDTRAKQTPALLEARRAILSALTGEAGRARFGLRVEAPAWLADDPGADPLDALICAAQAAWGMRALAADPALPARIDPVEGWIADPEVVRRLSAKTEAAPAGCGPSLRAVAGAGWRATPATGPR